MHLGFLPLAPFVIGYLIWWALRTVQRLEQREQNNYRDDVLQDIGDIDAEHEAFMRQAGH